MPSFSQKKLIEPRKWVSTYTRKQKRCYHRCISGLERGQFLKQKTLFLTLTSPKGASLGLLSKHFNVLVKRMERRLTNYVWLPNKGQWWRRMKPRPVNIQFAKVVTSEGQGTIHALIRLPFFPILTIDAMWLEIHGGFNNWITETWGRLARRAGYMTQYLSDQKGFLRLSYSASWIFEGSLKVWRYCYLKYRPDWSRMISEWRAFLYTPFPKLKAIELKLDTFG